MSDVRKDEAILYRRTERMEVLNISKYTCVITGVTARGDEWKLMVAGNHVIHITKDSFREYVLERVMLTYVTSNFCMDDAIQWFVQHSKCTELAVQVSYNREEWPT